MLHHSLNDYTDLKSLTVGFMPCAKAKCRNESLCLEENPIKTCGLNSSASEAKRQTVILEEIQYLLNTDCLNTDCYDQQNLRSVYLPLLNGDLKITGGLGRITATEPGTKTPPAKQQGWKNGKTGYDWYGRYS